MGPTNSHYLESLKCCLYGRSDRSVSSCRCSRGWGGGSRPTRSSFGRKNSAFRQYTSQANTPQHRGASASACWCLFPSCDFIRLQFEALALSTFPSLYQCLSFSFYVSLFRSLSFSPPNKPSGCGAARVNRHCCLPSLIHCVLLWPTRTHTNTQTCTHDVIVSFARNLRWCSFVPWSSVQLLSLLGIRQTHLKIIVIQEVILSLMYVKISTFSGWLGTCGIVYWVSILLHVIM